MQTIATIQKRFSEIGYAPEMAQIAFKDLGERLHPSETILNVAEGSYHNTLGVLIATDKRLFYVGVDKHKLPVTEQIPYPLISKVESQQGFTSDDVRIETIHMDEYIIRGCHATRAKELVELINILIEQNFK